MERETLLALLEQAAAKAGIKVRYEILDADDANVADGVCTWKGQFFLFIHKGRSLDDKIRILLGALRRADLDGIYLKPIVRDLIESDG